MNKLKLGLGKRAYSKVVKPKMWNVETKPIAWEPNSDCADDVTEDDLTDSDFELQS